ncbi:hypothetical protein RQP46_002939 [Phenoliferia psychrophenolica]
MSAYIHKTGGSLKLKGTAAGPANKKKKKSSSSSRARQADDAPLASGSGSGETRERDGEDEGDASPAPPTYVVSSGKTEAQRRFEEVQKKRLLEKAAKAAAKTHKERVAEFNEKLENLSEHYDIPKVGPG